MLTSQTNKELSGEWQRRRNTAMTDSTGISSSGLYGLDHLNITTEGNGNNDPKTYKIDTNPIDGITTPKIDKVDIRQRPECGD